MKKSSLTLMITILVLSTMLSPIKIVLANPTGQSSGGSVPWPMFRHDPQHTGFSTSTAPGDNKTTGGLIWTNTTGGEIHSSAAVVDGVVFIGSDDRKLYAFNATTGKKIWEKQLGTSTFTYARSSPAFADDMIFVGSLDKNVYALSKTNGNTIWTYPTQREIRSSPVVTDGLVIIGSNDKNVYALNKTNGLKVWNKTLGNIIPSSPAVANGAVYVGSFDNYVYALNITDGTIIAQNATDGQISSSPAIAYNLVFIGSNDGTLYALNASTLHKVWTFPIPSGASKAIESSPAVADGLVFVGSNNNYVYAINATTGKQQWNRTTGNRVKSSPAVADGKVFVGSDDGKLYALNKATGEIVWTWKTDPVGSIDSSPTVAEGKVFVGSLNGKVYAFGPNAQPIARFTFEPGQPIEYQNIKFNASSSSDPDFGDRIEQYEWDFGDGNKTTTINPVIYHMYRSYGNYRVTLVVTDSHQAKSSPTSLDIAILKHDVAIKDVKPLSNEVHLGEIINVNITVKNEGNFTENSLNVTAFADKNIAILGDEIVIGNVTIASLDPGKSTTVTIPWNTTGSQRGNYKISANVSQVQYEYNLNNNKFPNGFVSVKLHDVKVANINAQPKVVQQGAIIYISVTVVNQGDYNETVTVTAYANNKSVASAPPTLIAYGKNATITLQWNTTGAGGDYTLSANATVPIDQDPSDNYLVNGVVSVTIPGHDIKVSNVAPSKNIVFWPDSIDISVSILNQGNYDESNINVVAYADKNPTITGDEVIIGYKTITYLSRGSQSVVMFTWSTEGIPYEELPALYGITANATIAKDDYPDNNHYYDGAVSIRPPIHDVSVAKVTPSKTSVKKGTLISIDVTVENQGAYLEININVTAYADQNTTVIGDEVLIGRKIIDSLASLDSKIIVIPWGTEVTAGNYTISANATIPIDEDPSDNRRLSDYVVHILPLIEHDIAVTNILPLKTVLCKDRFTANITVTVANTGDFKETFCVLLNTTGFVKRRHYTIGIKNITLDPGSIATLTFQWNSSGVEKDIYTYFNATAGPVIGETNTGDNTLRKFCALLVSMEGDVAGPEGAPDGKVDIRDIASIAKLFGKIIGNPEYVANYDITNDGKIDIKDIAICARNFGKIDP